MLEEIEKNMKMHNKLLSNYACLDSEAIRFNEEKDTDIRTPFFRDIDRIIYSLSYNRYSDKTQVFSQKDNDHICKRMIHVQLVSKVARTIGRALNLNEDLIEAAALGHDLGHVPFGHVGESILNKISLENNEGYFNHNVQSVRILTNLEESGRGRNITLQVLDGILCHNGELALKKYQPVKKTKEIFLKQYEDTYRDNRTIKKLVPMTLESCVVRISDIIAYIGKDIEDAITLGVISIDDLPKNIKEVLGVNNKSTVNTLIMDVNNNSISKNYICMSDKVFNALIELKEFNYKNIYLKANTEEQVANYEKIFRTIFDYSLNALKNNNQNANIYKIYLANMNDDYKNNNSLERIVIDYIAGMTDDYILNEYNKIVNN